jgi:protein-disulfide isomerase
MEYHMRLYLIATVGFFFSLATTATPLLEYNGKKLRYEKLPASAQQLIYEIDLRSYQSKKSTIEQEVILNLYFEELARARKTSVSAVKASELKVKSPSAKQIKDFYAKNKHRIPYPLKQVKGEIIKLLKQELVSSKKKSLIKKVSREKKVKIYLKQPNAPKLSLSVKGFPKKGKTGAKLQIVEFADYQCPHCKHAAEMFKKVLPKYLDRVEFVYVDFPINPSGVSKLVAEGGHCATKQGKYWEYHYLAFEQQATLSKKSPTELAKKLGLDAKKFSKCLGSKEIKALVQRGKNEGQRVGVNGTPSIYFNGRKMNIAHDEAEMKAEIDNFFKSAI